MSLGRLACVEGDYGRSRSLVEQSLALMRGEGTNDQWGVAKALISLGEVSRCADD